MMGGENEHMSAEFRDYKVGDKGASGQEIESILGQSARIVVYTTVDKHLRWECDDENDDVNAVCVRALPEFNELMADIARHVPKALKKHAYHQLGKALFSAVDAVDADRAPALFAPLRRFVRQKALITARIRYVVAGLTTVSVALLALGLAYLFCDCEARVLYLKGTFMGVLGACVSIVQRTGAADLEPFVRREYLFLQGFSRVILGAAFGFFTVFAVQANIVMGFAQDSNPTLFVLCFVAGVSERFVPELIQRIERRQ